MTMVLWLLIRGRRGGSYWRRRVKGGGVDVVWGGEVGEEKEAAVALVGGTGTETEIVIEQAELAAASAVAVGAGAVDSR